MKKKIISLLVCFLLVTGCSGNSYKTIDSNAAMVLIEDNAIIIDVREVDEFNTGHIKDAINIPLANINNIEYTTDTTIILYCASGMRSSNAAEALIDMGYTNVYNLDGGLINWGFELVYE